MFFTRFTKFVLFPLALLAGVLCADAQVQTSGGGTPSAPGSCSSSNATNACLTGSPFNASAAGATTTATAATFAPGTTGAVASCSTFLAGQGVLIAGAGAAGGNYIGTIVSCTAGALTVSPATSTSVASGAVVQHDETAAFLAAITSLAAAGGGRILLNDGLYLVNGPLQDAAGANAILPLPKLPNYTNPMVGIGIAGFQRPNLDTPNGAIIQTSQNSGNLFGGYNSATGGGYPPFTNAKLQLQNLEVMVPTNPTITAVNATYLQALDAEHVLVRTVAATKPTTGTGSGILYPSILNELENFADDVTVAGFQTDLKFTEHTRIGSAYAQNATTCFSFDSGHNSTQPSTYNGNSVFAAYLWSMNCTAGIGTGSYPIAINVGLFDTELNTTDVNDPSGNLRGEIDYVNPYNSANCTVTASGAANIALVPLFCGASTKLRATPVSAGSPTVYTQVGAAAILGTVVGVQTLYAINGRFDGTNWVRGASTAGFSAVRLNSLITATGNSGPYNSGVEINTCPTGGAGSTMTAVDTNCAGVTIAPGIDNSAKPINRIWLNPLQTNSIPKNATGTSGQNIGSDTTLTVNVPAMVDSQAATILAANNANDKALVVQGAPSATANMQEWQDSTGAAHATIDAGGNVNGPAAAPTGTCAVAGSWVFSRDGHATFCPSAGGTWATKI